MRQALLIRLIIRVLRAHNYEHTEVRDRLVSKAGRRARLEKLFRLLSLVPGGAQEIVAQPRYGLLYRVKVVPEPGGVRQRRAGIRIYQALALRCQAYPNLPLVLRIAAAADETYLLEFLEDGRQRVGFEKQLFAEFPNRLIVPFGERDQCNVLRIGKSKLIENRLIGAAKGEVRRIDREAQEIRQLRLFLAYPGASRGRRVRILGRGKVVIAYPIQVFASDTYINRMRLNRNGIDRGAVEAD